LVLAENGRSKYRIVISRGATPSERYAAQEFRRLFREMSGVELPILEGARRDRFEIRIHDCEDVSVWEPGPDGYAIRARDDSITLAGGLPRGVVYAVYDFFEKRLGGRWFARDVAIMPRRDNMVLEPFHELHRPRFEYREVFYTEAFDGDFAARLRSNGAHARLDAKHGGKIAYFPFVHTFHTILPPDKYFKDHPEYFSEIDGRRVGAGAQLCLTNPDVLRLTIECVKGWIRDHPDAAIFSVSQNDCFNNCQCKSCKAIDEREGSPSGSLLAFVNKVAEAVPDRLIDTLAYQYTRRPPKNLKPRENVIVRLCSIECCFSHPIETCDVNQAFRDDLVAWSKVISWGRRWPEPVQRWVPGPTATS
ncbi:MAG: DUF4838 domain-containing protein, partial [Armatimonadetes bacterium]|nr:DUF4838 domain-containing protein [Armatimonadota bacterium]